MTDPTDEESKALTEAVLTASSRRTSEQWALIERAKSRNARSFGVDLDSITWETGVETVLILVLSLLLTPKLIQLGVGTPVAQMGQAAFIVVPIAWLATCVALAFGFGFSRLLWGDNVMARFGFDVVLGLVVYFGLISAAGLKLSDGPASREPAAAAAVASGPPVSIGELRSGVVMGDTALIDRALAGGVSADARTEEGETALMLAASLTANGRIPATIVRHLLSKGASVNLRDRQGRTALTNASGKLELVQLLAEHGANPNLAWQSDSVWEQLRGQDVDAVIAIATKFPDIRIPVDQDGKPQRGPVQVFAERGDLRLVRYFLSRGLSARDSLAGAIAKANELKRPEGELLPLVDMLLAAGDHPNNGGGWGALQWAGPFPAVVQKLIDAGADVNAVSYWYESEKSVLDFYGKARGAKVLRAAGGKTLKELRAAPP